ncbi:hypothetical protein LTR66_009043, partial [Elasticomyces elasticus]
MASPAADRQHLISPESLDPSDPSDLSSAPTAVETFSPHSPFRHRPAYARLSSIADQDQPGEDADHGDDITNAKDDQAKGLGISNIATAGQARLISVRTNPRVPTSSKPQTPNDAAATPDSSDPLFSSPSTVFQQPYNPRSIHGTHAAKRSVSSLQSSIHQPYTNYEDDVPLHHKSTFAESLRSVYQDFSPKAAGPTNNHFNQGRANWLSVSIIILSIYSTVFSGIFLVIAFRAPRYGRMIHTKGSLTASTASLLTALFAKTIELSFVTVFVAFLGQVLSRRAFRREHGNGVTLAEMNMRAWIMQPGTMITHWESVRYAAISVLGVVSLFAAVCAMLYTTASDALVQPQLKFGAWQDGPMQGLVRSAFSNPKYVAAQCNTPITTTMDKEYAGTTCLQIEHAAQGYHNYQRYLANWQTLADSGNGSTVLANRPQGFGLLHENTTVTASWIEHNASLEDMADRHGGRIINNVSLAMPHAGVFQAARDAKNGILQPEELDGLGVYSLRASVPSPVIHALCVNMNSKELSPLMLNSSNLGKPSAVDEIFGWGPGYGEPVQPQPVFVKYPIAYNTVLNHTGDYGRKSIYLLGKDGSPGSDVFVLCGLQASLTPFCSTRYNASQ